MAAGDVSVVINSETKAFKQGVDAGIIKPLEDAEKALEELGRSRGPEQLEQELRDAQRATERLADETKDAARKIEDEFRDTYRRVGDAGSDGLGKVKSSAQEVQHEVGSNMGEAFSSFRGDIEDVGQIGQDTLGGLAATAAGMGGAVGLGAAAGLGAVAAGVGVITDAFTEAEEAANQARDAAFGFAYDVRGALETAGYSERIAQWTTDTEKLQQVRDLAAGSGMREIEVLDALASGGDKLRSLTEAYNQNNTESGLAMGRALELDNILKGTAEGYLSGKEAAELAARANYDYATAVGEATGKTDDLGNVILRLPNGKEVVVDAETQQAHEDLDALEQRTVTARLVVDDSNVRNYRPPTVTVPTKIGTGFRQDWAQLLGP